MAVVAVPITHREEVAVAELQDVRVGQVCVLILFVRVVHRDATLRCEGKLGDDVLDLVCVFNYSSVVDAGVWSRVVLCWLVLGCKRLLLLLLVLRRLRCALIPLHR